MLTSYSRVTVVSGSRRVDLALPSALPVADVVPQVLRFCAPEESAGNPGEFTLARVGGQSLSLSQSLAEAGVRDGDVIELRSFTAQSRPAFVEDVRDAIEDSVDAAGGAWTSRSTATFAVVTLSAVSLLLLLPSLLDVIAWAMGGDTVLAGDPDAPGERIAGAFLASIVLVAAAWVGTRWAARWTPYVCITVAALAALVGGAELVGRSSTDPVVGLTVGVAAFTVVAVVCRLFTPRAMPLLAAGAVALVATVAVLLADVAGAPRDIAVRLVAALAVLSIGVMPRLSIAVGGLSSADYRIRNAGRMPEEALSARLQESSGLLLGAVVGVSVVVALIGYWLGLRGSATTDAAWDRVLSLSLAATLLLRSRVFSRVQFMLAPRIGALVIVLASVQQLARDSAAVDRWLLALVALAGLVGVALSILRLSDVTRARTKRALNLLEFLVVVDLVVVTMGAVGVYDYVRGG